MPFTPTHIAAILPFAWLFRWRLPLSALAIGSMVCDLGVFFPRLFSYGIMHSVVGLVTHCLPLGLVIYFVFHWLIKRPLIGLLPNILSQRMVRWTSSVPTLQALDLLTASLCLLFGAATHILWDSFTHVQRWGTKTFPVLNEVAFDSSFGPVYWYSVLQHGSSLVFLPPMLIGGLIYLMRQPRQDLARVPRVPASVKVLAAAAILIVPCAAYTYCVFKYPWASQLIWIHEAVKLAGKILITFGLVYGLGFSVLAKKEEQVDLSTRNV